MEKDFEFEMMNIFFAIINDFNATYCEIQFINSHCNNIDNFDTIHMRHHLPYLIAMILIKSISHTQRPQLTTTIAMILIILIPHIQRPQLTTAIAMILVFSIPPVLTAQPTYNPSFIQHNTESPNHIQTLQIQKKHFKTCRVTFHMPNATSAHYNTP